MPRFINSVDKGDYIKTI